MAFESKRLRVQLPCKEASLVERDIPVQTLKWPPGPDPCFLDTMTMGPACGVPSFCPFPSELQCKVPTRLCPDHFITQCHRFASPERCVLYASPYIVCGLPSGGDCGYSPICGGGSQDPTYVYDPEEEGAVLVRPEQLPLLRRQLEEELAQIAALRERGEQVESHLNDIAAAEEELKRQG